MNLNQIKKIYLIGIGGIGMSAVARLMLKQNKQISGSDREKSLITDGLKKLGAKIYIGHKDSNLSIKTDLVVYTTAIDKNNSELKKAKKLNIPTLRYSQFLGLLSRDKITIAISGTHGKTTTTALIGLIFAQAGFDPTVIVGSQVKEFKGNARLGQSDYLIVEACEHRQAFLDLEPDIIVLTNLEADHLDFYKTLTNLKQTFKKYLNKLPRGGLIVANQDDKNLSLILKNISRHQISYGLKKSADYSASEINLKSQYSQFKVIKNKKSLGQFKTHLSGQHNIYNILAAISFAKGVGVTNKEIQTVLNSFKGTWRRFDIRTKNKKQGIVVIDDYAHHPTEIKATLSAVKVKYPNRKIWTVFQPHLNSRTQYLFKEFSQAFNLADEIILAPIYEARGHEKKVNPQNLVKAIYKYNPHVQYIDSFKKIEDFLQQQVEKNDVVLIIGAGDIYKLKI
ncbi:MAG: UDP-N-acetylmuramate--L-alanine ligase [Patescibacteria group bacterium]|nr:UDP-N-acetylmuramate--L-alanine ligase [Patescibacteria group bacterium]